MTRPDSPDWSVTTKALVGASAIVLSAIVIWRFRTLITPIVIAIIVAYLINPVISWVERRTRCSEAPRYWPFTWACC